MIHFTFFQVIAQLTLPDEAFANTICVHELRAVGSGQLFKVELLILEPVEVKVVLFLLLLLFDIGLVVYGHLILWSEPKTVDYLILRVIFYKLSNK